MSAHPPTSPRTRLARGALVGLLSLVACAGNASTPSAPPAANVKPTPSVAGEKVEAFGLPLVLPKLRLMPDLESSRGVVLQTSEGELSLFGRMRLRVSPLGVIERADDLLPVGRVVANVLPARLGGGYVFLAASGRGTELWRSNTWLGPLEPLASFGTTSDSEEPLVIGFDRLYLRMRTGNEIVALGVKDGAPRELGPLPIAPAHGDMVFLDAWRGVVDTDLAGTFATFDAGATWRKLAIAGRVRSIEPLSKDPDDGDEANITTDNGVYRLSADGHLTFAPGAPATRFASPPGEPLRGDGKRSAAGPLGRRPLRVAIERGFPDGASSALVLQEGTLSRVSLSSGEILESVPHATPDEHAECFGIGLSSDRVLPRDAIGFVCGAASGPTVIYQLERPLVLREVMRFATPRVVVESGQGAIVVRGSCNDAEPPKGARPFCVRFADGSTREVRVRGDVGAERVVALRDKRVVILVPPRAGAQGQISILEGQTSKHIVLKMPDAGGPRELETGMWLEGVHQLSADTIGAWVEAGGPTLGVHIKLDGQVTVGDAVDEPGGVMVSGRFALAVGDRGRLLESVDTGASWRELDLPVSDDAGSSRSRRCGAVGCVLSSWLKVGWGALAHENDLREAAAPSSPKLSQLKLSGPPLSLSCQRGDPQPKPPAAGKKNEGSSTTGWSPLRAIAAPPMQKGELGVDNGSPFDAVPMRAYAWGKKDSDWSRTGRFLLRFSDKYALADVRSSAVTMSPFANEAAASEAIGAGSQGSGVSWSAQRDRGAALLSACRGRACNIFAVEQNQPVLTLRGGEPGPLSRPFSSGAVKLGQVWYFLGDTGQPEQVALYRSELGTVRQVGALKRLGSRFMSTPLPRLVRRAKSDDIGLLFTLRDGPLDKRGVRYVLPLDAGTGESRDPIRLGRADFSDVEVAPTCAERDGWVVELALEPTPDIEVGDSKSSFDSVELRMRLDERTACVEGGAGTLGSLEARATPAGGGGPKKGPSGQAPAKVGAFPLIATDRNSGERRELRCTAGKRL